MSRHEGVSCDNCLVNDFGGKRFKCLICYDYDLCENCYYQQVSTGRHLSSHAMQCILTRKEFDLYYGGEAISPESPPSFVCPFCCKLGFTETSLQEHIIKEHEDQHTEVVCPVCSSLPSGEPNLVTDDLAHHLSMEHRTSRDVDDPIGGRHIRRMLYPGRGMRSRNHRNMHFSGGPIGTSAIPTASLVASNNNTSSSARESMDPIAELLSQLSGVRRSAQQLQQNTSTATQLHELQSQLQQERQRAAEIRQQLEKFPNKPQSSNATSQSVNVHPSGGVTVASRGTTGSKKPPTALHADEEDDSRYLLAKLDDVHLSDEEQEIQFQKDIDRSHFTQELILSMLASDYGQSEVDNNNSEQFKPHLESAVAIDCPLSSSTTVTHNPANPSSSHDLQLHVSSAGTQNSSNPSSRNIDNSSSHSNQETGMLPSDYMTSPVDFSLSVTGQDQDDDRFGDSSAVSSRSAPALGPGEQYALPETAGQWRYQGTLNEDKKDSEEDEKPPSPLQEQRHGLRIQNHVFPSGSVRVAGGPIAEYGREDVATGSLNKNVR